MGGFTQFLFNNILRLISIITLDVYINMTNKSDTHLQLC